MLDSESMFPQGLPTRPAGEISNRPPQGLSSRPIGPSVVPIKGSPGSLVVPIKTSSGSIVGISSSKAATCSVGTSSRSSETVGTSTRTRESVGTNTSMGKGVKRRGDQGPEDFNNDDRYRGRGGSEDHQNGVTTKSEVATGKSQQVVVIPKSEVVAIKLRGRDKAISRPR